MKIAVIGLGHQSEDDHLPAIRDSEMLELVAVCDLNIKQAEKMGLEYGVPHFTKVELLLESLRDQLDVALVAVPHSSYLPIIESLASASVHIIKEKPFATSKEEAVEIAKCIKRHNVGLRMTLQRRFNPVFTSFKQLVKRIGKVRAIEGRYVMNIARLDEGWRASQLHAGGGALIDLGYHYIDLLTWYWGLPDEIMCQLSSGGREDQVYDVEDTVFLQFTYGATAAEDGLILGNLVISRTYPQKSESLVAYGTKGHVSVSRGRVSRVYHDSEFNESREETLERVGSWPSALIDQLEICAHEVVKPENRGLIPNEYLDHIAFFEAAYRSARNSRPCNPRVELDGLKDCIDA